MNDIAYEFGLKFNFWSIGSMNSDLEIVFLIKKRPSISGYNQKPVIFDDLLQFFV